MGFCEVNQGAVLEVNLDPPSAKPVLEGVEKLLEVKGCCGWVFMGRQQGSGIGKCKKAGGVVCGDFLFKQHNAVFDRETSRREELQSSFLRPHTHRCPGRASRHLTITSTINYRTINGTTQRP